MMSVTHPNAQRSHIASPLKMREMMSAQTLQQLLYATLYAFGELLQFNI